MRYCMIGGFLRHVVTNIRVMWWWFSTRSSICGGWRWKTVMSFFVREVSGKKVKICLSRNDLYFSRYRVAKWVYGGKPV